MYTLKTFSIILICCLFLSRTATAQGDIPEASKDVPEQMKGFKKANKKATLKAPVGTLLERLVEIMPGKYTNEHQSELIPHVYELTPIWKGRDADTYWFYEGISNAFDSNDPFSRHIVSVREKEAGEVVWTYYHTDSLQNHVNIYKEPS